MLKKENWQERESVSDSCHDRTGQLVKRSDKKLGQNSSKRRFSDARQLGCVFQDMTPPKSILRKGTDMPKQIQRVKFTEAIARHTKIRDQNPSFGEICPGEPHERSPNAPKFEDRSQEETEWQEQGAREAAWKLAKSVLKLKEHQRAAFFSPSENRCLPASTLKPEEREFVVDSGASMHMISKKDLSEAEMDTLTKSCSPTIVITANGEVQTRRRHCICQRIGPIRHGHASWRNSLNFFLGKLCEDHGYTYHWTSGQKPHLTKKGKRIDCNISNYVPFVVPGLSTSSCTTYYAFIYLFITFITGFRFWRKQKHRKSRIRQKWMYEWGASGKPVAWTNRNRKQESKWRTRRSTNRSVTWIAGLAAGVQREFGRWK